MMAKESAASPPVPPRLDALGAAAGSAAKAGRRPPVHLWNPPFCGDIAMRIAADGTWFHEGTPIGRPALVRLFASILRRDPEGVMLVTPVEKVRIVVDDAPFVAVALEVADGDPPALRFRTNVDEWVTADAEHPLRFAPGPSGGLKPYLEVRPGLPALLKRSLLHELAERGEVRTVDGVAQFGVASAGLFFPMAPAAQLDGLL